MRRRTLVVSLAVVVAPLVAVAARAARGGGPVASARYTAERGDPARVPDRERTADATPVRVVPVRRGSLVVPVVAAGEAVGSRLAVVAPYGGRVTHVAAGEGQRVGARARLVTLDSTDALLDLAQARASQRQAEVLYRELVANDGHAADSATRAVRREAASARSGREAAAVAVARAELALRRAVVRAPVAGRVADVVTHVGRVVRAGDELMAVVSSAPLRVEVQLPETEYGDVALGREAAVTFAALPGRGFPATVVSLNPRVEPESRSLRVALAVRDPGRRVLPGMHARASIEGRTYPDRLLVPVAAVVERDQRSLVFTYEPTGPTVGRAWWRYVTVGVANDSLVAVEAADPRAPIEPGAMVIVEGHETLTHDALVRLAVPRPRPARSEPLP